MELGMSQQELAKRMGLTDRSTICDIEKGKRGIGKERLVRLAFALSCNPQDLDPEYTSVDDEFLPLIKAYTASDVDLRKAICTILRIDYIKPKRDHSD